jgi:hypothetical protein
VTFPLRERGRSFDVNDKQKIRTLLTSAGMLMEDASACVVLEHDDVAAAIKLLRDTAHDLRVIANVVDVINRAGRLPR